MIKYFAISRLKENADEIINLICKRYADGCSKEDRGKFFFSLEVPPEDISISFNILAEAIEKEIENDHFVYDRFIGILDFTGRPLKGNPPSARSKSEKAKIDKLENDKKTHAEEIESFRTVQGRLILAFPEILWIPLYENDDVKQIAIQDGFQKLEEAVKLCKGDFSPLFDGDGLRGLLMERAHRGTDAPPPYLYTRTDVGFAIDEEANFSFINAYTAYRFGYRAFPISSKAGMGQLLGNEDKKQIPHASSRAADPNIHIVTFEDICLEFPDANKGEIARDLDFGDKRIASYQMLDHADLNVVTTAAGEDEKVANDKTQTLEKYFRRQNRRQVSRKREWIEFKERWYRRVFNHTGGFWWGYWFANIVEAAFGASVIITAFFWDPRATLFAVFGVFLLHGVLRQPILRLAKSNLLKRSAWAKWMRKREQWAFMPKCYEGHCPIELGNGRRYWEVERKPLAGIFGLRNKCQLPNGRNYSLLFRSEDIKAEYKAAIRGKKPPSSVTDTADGHAAPGVALEISTFLIRRAERMKDSIIDAEGAIHAAVLANTALELLKYKTPSVAIDALKWKHYYEVLAECSFIGVRAHLDMNDRFIDIHNAMGRICRAEDGSVRESVFLSGMAELIDNLAKLLSSEGKAEEANFFATKARRYHRKLMPTFFRALFAYPEWVLRSWMHFTASLVTFMIVFLIYLYQQTPDFWEALRNMYIVMVTGQQPSIGCEVLVIALAKQIGALHIGMIATAFFLRLNRK